MRCRHFGELPAKAQTANIQKMVVGRSGTTIPTAPRAKSAKPAVLSNIARTPVPRAGALGGGWSAGGKALSDDWKERHSTLN